MIFVMPLLTSTQKVIFSKIIDILDFTLLNSGFISTRLNEVKAFPGFFQAKNLNLIKVRLHGHPTNISIMLKTPKNKGNPSLK